ncbi:MAG: LysM peptidoglycan-binding domain-containing protein [Firmicutes bacterium]|nr:LysM peptidoglycan-binding domain-containing protein [Bacillota bacterium]
MAQRQYTVQSGDSLFQIGRNLGTVPEGIYLLNRLESDALSVGQILKIPAYVEALVLYEDTPVYRWESTQGQTLGVLDAGARLEVTDTTQRFFEVKYLQETGYILREDAQLLAYDGSVPVVEILGYYTQAEGADFPSSEETFRQNTDVLTSTGLFFWRLDAAEPVILENSASAPPAYIDDLVMTGHRNNVLMLGVVHNLLYGDRETSYQTAQIALSSEENRRALTQSILELVQEYNLDGINMDIEDMEESDKENYVAFLETLAEALHQQGKWLAVCVPSKLRDDEDNDFSAPFDYEAIGQVADQVVIMLYNEHGWPGSGPGPVSSSPWMRRVLDYAVERIPPEKILAAVGLFGFDFNLSTERVRYLSYAQVQELLERYHAVEMFDEATQTPMFTYTAENGEQHEVWYDNERSIEDRARVAEEYGIAGLALWRMGLGDPEVWQMLRTQVVVRKGV